MPTFDAARETARVGAALASVPLHKMILEMAKGVAWGQFELEKTGVQITKMMGVPDQVEIGGESLSMLEAGFLPSFYHFVDSILELKMEVEIREENKKHASYSDAVKASMSTELGVDAHLAVDGEIPVTPGASVNAGLTVDTYFETKTDMAYSKSLDAGFSQQFNQDLTATSEMRTKLVPKPPPDVLVERIKIMIDKLRRETEAEDNPDDIPFGDRLMKKVEDNLLKRVENVGDADKLPADDGAGDGSGTDTSGDGGSGDTTPSA